jgi:hypothetical protein
MLLYAKSERKERLIMNFRFSGLILIMFFLCCASDVTAQSTLNPDVSVIPRFRLESNDGVNLPAKREFSRPDFSMEEFELALQAYLNPYARADIFLTKPGLGEEPVEVEEAYATFLRGLPLDLNVRMGKYLAEFGKLNSLHPHAWPFLTQPLSQARFLGNEGINDLGVSASILIPTGATLYTKLTVDVLKGSSVAALDPNATQLSGGPGLVDTVSPQPYYANSARLMTFLPVGDNSDLEIGLSGLTGIHDPYNHYRFYYGNLDFKYKWKPDLYRSFVLQGEGLLNFRKVKEGGSDASPVVRKEIVTGGFYVSGDYQFRKIFSIGARYDWTLSPYSKDDKAQGVAVFLGFYPVEETTAFRLQYQHTRTESPGAAKLSVNTVTLQFMFSMGPHKAHPF